MDPRTDWRANSTRAGCPGFCCFFAGWPFEEQDTALSAHGCLRCIQRTALPSARLQCHRDKSIRASCLRTNTTQPTRSKQQMNASKRYAKSVRSLTLSDKMGFGAALIFKASICRNGKTPSNHSFSPLTNRVQTRLGSWTYICIKHVQDLLPLHFCIACRPVSVYTETTTTKAWRPVQVNEMWITVLINSIVLLCWLTLLLLLLPLSLPLC